ncbi:MAG: hypothetical protein QM817_18370 [Archangium sp.]
MGALTMTLLALTLMASFSISHSVHERIRLQLAADAHAFSVATLEARGFNTLGYMNRAIAGGIVAELGLHAWYAIAERDVSMYMAGFVAFIQIAIMEFAQCPYYYVQHCFHGINALRIAFQYMNKKNQAENDLRSKEQDWKDAVKAYNDMIKDVYKDEKELLKKVKGQIGSFSPVLMSLSSTTAKNAQSKNIAYNQKFFACALEGSDIDSECEGSDWKKDPGVSSASDRNEVMNSAAYAARPIFEAGRGMARHLSGEGYKTFPVPPFDFDLPMSITMKPQKMMDIQSDGTYTEFSFGKQNTTLNGNDISSSLPIGFVIVTWNDGVGFFITNGSRSNGGYEGVPCNGNGGCFINFRLGQASNPPDDDTDYGQPATYGAYSSDLRELNNGGGKGAWEIEGKGEVNYLHTQNEKGNGDFKFVPDNNAVAVAKGKAYFHQLGQNGWQVPPNLFDPFWRAKLHPFLRNEIQDVLQKAGDTKGKDVISSGGAVEGVKQ